MVSSLKNQVLVLWHQKYYFNSRETLDFSTDSQREALINRVPWQRTTSKARFQSKAHTSSNRTREAIIPS